MVVYAALILLAGFLLAPFAWMVLVSLHPSKAPIPTMQTLWPQQCELIGFNPAGCWEQFHWENYAFVLSMPDIPVARFFFNSILVTTVVVAGQLLVASLAAYGFARLTFKGRDFIFLMFLLSMMFAGPVTQIPVYLMVRWFGWLNTYSALIVPGLGSAFSVFLFRQFFAAIPKELEEAARMDGAGDLRIYAQVIMPLSKAALATAGAFSFFAVWTDFFWPLLATNSMEMRTLEVGLSVFKNSYGATNWPLQMTAAVVVMLPLLVAFLFTQRYFTKGIMLGGLK
ncbi:MAG: carbohydrate ABC transporter permease [Nitrospirae bacterium]|nr:carbohydrate ABC transporter permease [Fimbriimonadaceae bacterium]